MQRSVPMSMAVAMTTSVLCRVVVVVVASVCIGVAATTGMSCRVGPQQVSSNRSGPGSETLSSERSKSTQRRSRRCHRAARPQCVAVAVSAVTVALAFQSCSWVVRHMAHALAVKRLCLCLRRRRLLLLLLLMHHCRLRILVRSCAVHHGSVSILNGRRESLGRHALHCLACLLLSDKMIDRRQGCRQGYLKLSLSCCKALHLLLVRECAADRHVECMPVPGRQLVRFAPDDRQQSLLNLLLRSKLESCHAANHIQIQGFRQRTSLWTIAWLRRVG